MKLLLCIEDRAYDMNKKCYLPYKLKSITKGRYYRYILRYVFDRYNAPAGYSEGIHYLIEGDHGKVIIYHTRFADLKINKQVIVL